jgi:hypothetical protein
MEKKIVIDISQKKLLTTKEAVAYTGFSRYFLRPWATKFGAVKKISNRLFYDKAKLDEYIDQIAPEPVKE